MGHNNIHYHILYFAIAGSAGQVGSQNSELSEIFRHAWNLGINIPYL